MRSFTLAELAALRRTQTSAMMDTCVILSHSAGATDAFGNPTDIYVAGESVPCGYKPRSTREAQQGNETVLIDAEMRLPVMTVIKATDRVRLLRRYGETLAVPLLFSVVGQPAQGPSGLVVNLRKVTHDQ